MFKIFENTKNSFKFQTVSFNDQRRKERVFEEVVSDVKKENVINVSCSIFLELA